MTTLTVSPRAELGRALLAEWTKLRTLRSTIWIVAVSSALTVGLGAVTVAASALPEYDAMTPAQLATVDPAGEGIWYHGLHLGQVILAVLGVLSVTGEYSTGTIRATLAAVPDRGRVLAAKLLAVGGLSLAVGLVQAYVMAAIAQPMLATRGVDMPVTDPRLLRGVALAGMATAGVALLGLGAGLLIRHTAGAVGTLLTVMLGFPIIGLSFPDSWATVTRLLPPSPGWAMFTPTSDWLAPGPATAVFAAWVAAVLAAAAVLFVRRDA